MHYVAFVGTAGAMPEEALAIMNSRFPAWLEEVDRRGVRVFGRELELPDSAVTVRVRDGRTLVTDGPFAETKEFVAGFDLLDCVDINEVIEVISTSPVTLFHPYELRPLPDGVRLGARLAAFAEMDDSAGHPVLITAWTARDAEISADDWNACDVWRDELSARGVLIAGGRLGDHGTATTVRVPDGNLQLTDGSFIDVAESMATIDIVSCPDRQQVIELAAAHPLAAAHAVELRPFYVEGVSG